MKRYDWGFLLVAFFFFGCKDFTPKSVSLRPDQKHHGVLSSPFLAKQRPSLSAKQPPSLSAKQPPFSGKKSSPQADPPAPAWMIPSQMRAILGLLPTTYYIADETKVSCRGRYRRYRYRGHERSRIRDLKGRTLAVVCSRFYRVLKMEGTGLLRPRRGQRLLVNWDALGRFRVVRRCRFGVGVQQRCLLPFHTIAADLSAYAVGDILYIPRLRGLRLPDGSEHSGLFIVQDTGGAFRRIGPRRVDLFVGTQTSANNVFLRAGVHHRRSEIAFQLKGIARQHALRYFKRRFPRLFSHRS